MKSGIFTTFRPPWPWVEPYDIPSCSTLTMNCATPWHYLNVVQTDFWYSSSFGVNWPSNFCHIGIFTNDDIPGVGGPIDLMFDSMVGFWEMEDQLDLFPVAPNPTWPPSCIFHMTISMSTLCLVLG